MTERTCNQCGLTKLIDEFGLNKTLPLGRSYMCKPCRRSYDKERYRKKTEQRKSSIYQSRRVTVARNRELLWSILTSTPCADCGLVDPVVMEFDHTGSDKTYNIGALLGNSYSWDTIKVEIEKCDLVCANCHRHRTVKRGGWWRSTQIEVVL